MNYLKASLRTSISVLLGLGLSSAFAEASSGSDSGSNSGPGASGFVVQAGAFSATQGDAQHININGLIGDDFSVNKNTAQNFLLGLGYYFKGYHS